MRKLSKTKGSPKAGIPSKHLENAVSSFYLSGFLPEQVLEDFFQGTAAAEMFRAEATSHCAFSMNHAARMNALGKGTVLISCSRM